MAGWARLDQMARGPGGRRLCRWCGQEVPPGRLTFCGPNCIDEHKVRTDPGHVRRLLAKRDLEVCAACGLDCSALKLQLQAEPDRRRRLDLLHRHGWSGPYAVDCAYSARSLWDADHIVPVVEGGGGCGLEGYRTLCVPCHLKATAELRARLSAKRKRKRCS